MEVVIDVEKEKQEILKRYRGLLRACKRTRDDHDKKLIRKALTVAINAHKEMRRKSGEPYIYHPIEVARIVADEIGLGTTSVVCALLHDTVEDTYITLDDINRMFGDKVMKIVDGLTKISSIADPDDSKYSLQAENFRRILLTLSDDIRVILIKLADRLHNMRTMEFMPRHKQLKIAYETLNIYAPLAHRLGLYAIKTELEDLGLRYTEPELYLSIEENLASTQKKRTRYINKFSLPIINVLTDKGFNFDIKGRTKSIFSIAQKMKKKEVNFDEVYDIFAIRIILNSKPEDEKTDCWKVYSNVTDLYTPRPDRLRDWISTPKGNGYESLHTTVMGLDGKWVEVQIRTARMDSIAEKGLAAHWKYKSMTAEQETHLDTWISKITKMLEAPENDALEFIDDFKLNFFADEIHVFTPAGDIKTLPKGATTLDFAYEIHSRVGDQCIGAKVNHKLVPLSQELQSGEQIEIITSKKQTPKEEWLNFVVTAKAKSAIKDALKEEHKKTAFDGKEIFKEWMQVINEPINTNILGVMVKHFDLKSTFDFYLKIALKEITLEEFNNFFRQKEDKKNLEKLKRHKSKTDKIGMLNIGSEGNIKYTIATCCNPIPGDEVFGFQTDDQGILIHKTNCPNAMHLLSNFAGKSIKAQWTNTNNVAFLTGVEFVGIDDVGLVNKITSVISKEAGVNIKSIFFNSEDSFFEGKIMLYVTDTEQLKSLIEKLKQINGVHKVNRLMEVAA
ncbi:MAG: RelA/SpoT family protein [Bacteroidetes bacterium]|nr:RelA/SpoT family protein [Bacteroidota bacterium]